MSLDATEACEVVDLGIKVRVTVGRLLLSSKELVGAVFEWRPAVEEVSCSVLEACQVDLDIMVRVTVSPCSYEGNRGKTEGLGS